MRSQSRHSVSSPAYRIAAALIILFAFFLRARTLGHRSIWFDEALEFWVATLPLGQLLAGVRDVLMDPPLYSVLLHFWMLLGEQEFMLRFPSLICSVLSVALLMRVCRRWFGRRTALLAGLLMAIMSTQVRYAQETGQYALMTLGIVANLWALGRALERGEMRWWWAWAGTVVVCLYSYYGSAISVVSAGLFALGELAARRRVPVTLRLAVAGAVAVLAVLPLVLVFLPHQAPRGPGSGLVGITIGTSADEFNRFVGESAKLLRFQVTDRWSEDSWLGRSVWVAWLPLVLALTAACVAFVRRRGTRGRLVLCLAVTWAVYYVASRFNFLPFGYRHSLIIAPLLCMTLALGIDYLAGLHWAPATALAGWIVVVALVSPAEGSEDLRSITRFWISHDGPADTTYVYYGAIPAFSYYLRLEAVAPAYADTAGVWYKACQGNSARADCPNLPGVRFGAWLRERSAAERLASIHDTLGTLPPRLWIISSHITGHEDWELVEILVGQDYRVALTQAAESASAYRLDQLEETPR